MPGTDHEEQLARIMGYLHGLGADYAQVGPDTELIESGYLDSLGIVSLVAFIEKTFDMEIPEDDFTPAHFTSARSISEMVTSRKSARAGSQ
jgi:acyl carrier protein